MSYRKRLSVLLVYPLSDRYLGHCRSTRMTMASTRSRHIRHLLSNNNSLYCRSAHVVPSVPMPSTPPDVPMAHNESPKSQIDRFLLSKALELSSSRSDTYRGPIFASSTRLLDQYSSNREKELGTFLAMEPKPTSRRVDPEDMDCPISLIAYVSGAGQISEQNAKVCVASGFTINVNAEDGLESEYWLSCAHALEVGIHIRVTPSSDRPRGCSTSRTTTIIHHSGGVDHE
jgi:hypothetical protein